MASAKAPLVTMQNRMYHEHDAPRTYDHQRRPSRMTCTRTSDDLIWLVDSVTIITKLGAPGSIFKRIGSRVCNTCRRWPSTTPSASRSGRSSRAPSPCRRSAARPAQRPRPLAAYPVPWRPRRPPPAVLPAAPPPACERPRRQLSALTACDCVTGGSGAGGHGNSFLLLLHGRLEKDSLRRLCSDLAVTTPNDRGP